MQGSGCLGSRGEHADDMHPAPSNVSPRLDMFFMTGIERMKLIGNLVARRFFFAHRLDIMSVLMK
jgi:hypothetical protein